MPGVDGTFIQLTGGDYVDPVMFPPFILRSRGRMMNLFHGRGSELLRLRDSAPCNHSRFSRASLKRVPPSSERSTADRRRERRYNGAVQHATAALAAVAQHQEE